MFNSVSAWLGVFVAGAHDRITNVARREDGQALVEYGLILALVAVVCVATLVLLGGDINTQLTKITDKL